MFDTVDRGETRSAEVGERQRVRNADDGRLADMGRQIRRNSANKGLR